MPALDPGAALGYPRPPVPPLAALAAPLLLAAAEAEPPGEPPPLPLVAAVAVAPEGELSESPLRRDGESLVHPRATFRVEAGVPLADARLSLYDAQEALVSSEGLAEIGSAGSRFTLSPRPPLRPGSSYLLRLEGAAEREIHDLSGRSYRPLTFPIRTGGETPPPKSRPKKRRR